MLMPVFKSTASPKDYIGRSVLTRPTPISRVRDLQNPIMTFSYPLLEFIFPHLLPLLIKDLANKTQKRFLHQNEFLMRVFLHMKMT